MSVEYAVLGALQRGPMSGYDLKKLIQHSPYMPWSGNSNQVYKALAALLEEGYVDGELMHRDALPSKKLYTITEVGREALRRWAALPSDEMELRKPFLLKLSCAGALGARQVDELLKGYERQLQMQLAMREREAVSGEEAEHALEVVIERLIEDNVKMSYRAEMKWVGKARAQIAPLAEAQRRQETDRRTQEQEETGMRYEWIEAGGYLHYRAGEVRPETIEATQIIADCMEHRTNAVMIDEGALPESFFRLRTGVAGELMQKLGQYHVTAALVMDVRHAVGKFKEMLLESNRGQSFRSFTDLAEAECWLLAANVGSDGS